MAGRVRAGRRGETGAGRLAAEFGRVICDPEVKAELLKQGVEPGRMNPAELAAFQKHEVE